ncbi:DUF3857 domain-containing protein [Qipengyuania sp. MTN3-11]|uniref:DUF3857 domain-containing protein n=1 Tax=Qipengyuania sp. MTN3-11 TaxID=3056557 RepID=UPI0036F30271
MYRIRVATVSTIAIACAAFAVPAAAGDEPLYQPVPDWIDSEPLSAEDLAAQSPLVRAEKRVRLEDGRVWTYSDAAIRLATPEALTQMNQISHVWMPDKGDLIVHAVELVRDGEVIDLLENGSRFEVLRREQQLENRVLDGRLTATMPVSGARVGDVLRMAVSVTISDQALGDEMQFADILMTEPVPFGDFGLSISWPEDADIKWKISGEGADPKVETEGGYTFLDVPLPLPEQPEMPGDAPHRYLLPPILTVSSFADYAEVAAVMAPYYRTEGAIEPGSDLMREVEKIAETAGADRKRRAVLATQFVQDRVSYLMNGLDGGNYLPQSPMATWEERSGDCKAKSLLLAAMLDALGVEAESVLVRTQAGDAVPALLPAPASFNHVIVRATIDGENYWLDGTSRGTRLANMDEVPAFYHALPLRENGAELIAIDERGQSVPDSAIRLTLDSRAGLGVPALFDISIAHTGASAVAAESLVQLDDEEATENMVRMFVSRVLGDVQMTEFAADFDAETGIATYTAEGLMTTPWTQDRGIYRLSAPGQAAADFTIGGNRSRAAWRDIPLRMNFPLYFTSDVEVLLPDGAQEFTLRNSDPIDTTIAGVRLTSDAVLSGDRLSIEQSNRSTRREIPASEIAEARRQAALHERALPLLVAPDDVTRSWQYGDDRSPLAAIEATYEKLIADADADEPLPYVNRAAFREGTLDFAGALADYDAALAIEEDENVYSARASLKAAMGDLEGALADIETAENLSPTGWSYGDRVDWLGRLGRSDEALSLAEEYAAFAEERYQADQVMAVALGWAGRAEEGIALLEATLDERPGDGSTLNALCWLAGTNDAIDPAMLERCEEAVQRSNYSPAALDSRALAHYRVGDYAAALADAEAALREHRLMPETRYLRGLILIAQGDREGGQASIAEATAMRPAVSSEYARWGLVP